MEKNKNACIVLCYKREAIEKLEKLDPDSPEMKERGAMLASHIFRALKKQINKEKKGGDKKN